MIREKITEYALTGVVICSCSPRMHEQTFRKACCNGWDSTPYMVEIANIREQCSWIHKDKEDSDREGHHPRHAPPSQRCSSTRRSPPATSPVTKRALVIGGGIAGIQTALDIAEAGFEVDIVEKKPTIGGKMTQIDKTFPTLDCAACILTPKMVDCAQNEKIHIYSYSRGRVGRAALSATSTVKIQQQGPLRRRDVSVPAAAPVPKSARRRRSRTSSTSGLDTRRAIYIPFAQAVPKVATIDPDYCNMLKNGKCGVCAQGLHARARLIISSRMTIIEQRSTARSSWRRASTRSSWTQFDEFAYSQSPDVVTSLEFERLMNAAGPTGGTLAPSVRRHAPADHRLRPVRRLPRVTTRSRARATARRSAACTRQSTPCSAAKNIRIPTSTCSTSTCVPPARTLTSSTAALSRNTASITSRAWSARSSPRDGKLKVQASDLLDNRAAAYRRRHGRPGRGHRAGQVGQKPLRTMLTASHGHERLLHRGASRSSVRSKARRRASSSPARARGRRTSPRRSRRRPPRRQRSSAFCARTA